MTTVAHQISKLLPRPLAEYLRPRWHFSRDVVLFMLRKDGRFSKNPDIDEWVASRPMSNGKRMKVVVRSYKEFRRFYYFCETGALAHPSGTVELLDKWIRSISDCEVLYDVGSSNGLEGFHVHHLHGSTICFIEPFTPSIETILKTAWVQQQDGADRSKFEVVHAACDAEENYARLYMHDRPVPGSTANSFSEIEAYDAYDGRGDWAVVSSQWVKSISLDSLHSVYNLPRATHVKIDVDGFEERVMSGADELLKSGNVRSWMIEISGEERVTRVRSLMSGHGYVEIDSQEHYPDYEHYTGDHYFVRKDLVDDGYERVSKTREGA